MLPVVWMTRGNPRGEPFAEDFDFLRRGVLEGGGSWFDGGGSLAFWRPVAHQLYYRTLGNLVIDHPARIGLLHIVLLALGGLLLYRVMRRAWPGPLAFAAASFPLLAESTRTLICWPGHIVDLGAFTLLVAGLHEAVHRRAWSAVPLLLGSLLCKELALVGVVLLPFVPGAFDRGERRRWIAICGVLSVVWALAYVAVRRHAHLELPHGLERNPALIATPLGERLAWAMGNSLRATFSLARAPHLLLTALVAALAAFATALAFLRSAPARARLGAMRAWALWGGAWCVLSWAALATIHPFWAPNRSQLGSVGFGVGALAIASAVHPLAPAALVAGRLGLVAIWPETPRRITPEPEDRGAFMDYPKLSRLQQLMRASRTALQRRFPTLPHGALVAWHDLPLSAEYAFGGSLALQVWYRDTTLRVTTLEAFAADPALPVRAFLSYQPRHLPQVVIVDPDAERAKLAGIAGLREGRWAEAAAAFDRADSAQSDRAAMVFLGDVAGRRALALAQLGRWREAEKDARFAISAAVEDVGARSVLVAALAKRHADRAALGELALLLRIAPGDADALAMKQALETRLAAFR